MERQAHSPCNCLERLESENIADHADLAVSLILLARSELLYSTSTARVCDKNILTSLKNQNSILQTTQQFPSADSIENDGRLH
jgi:hypothetical protein